jgi:transposase
MDRPILGIDIAKGSFDVLLIHGDKQQHRSFLNRAEGFALLSKWLQECGLQQVNACMEATGRYGEELAQYLYEQGHQVSVVNPARIRDYARSKLTRNKTDKLDAKIIAFFCLNEKPALWTPPAPEIRELQALVRHLEALQDMRTQENNRLKSGVPSKQVCSMLEEHLEFLDQQIRQIKKRIKQHIDQHPDLKRDRDLLITIPGIGDTTATKLLSENIQAFSDGRALAAFAGLNPSLCLSGTSVHHRGRLSRVGRSGLRKSLYFPAISAMRFNPQIIIFCDRLVEKHKPSMVVIAAAMRKLLCLSLGVLKSGLPFDPSYTQNAYAIP